MRVRSVTAMNMNGTVPGNNGVVECVGNLSAIRTLQHYQQSPHRGQPPAHQNGQLLPQLLRLRRLRLAAVHQHQKVF